MKGGHMKDKKYYYNIPDSNSFSYFYKLTK
jgi:hypothetical protein